MRIWRPQPTDLALLKFVHEQGILTTPQALRFWPELKYYGARRLEQLLKYGALMPHRVFLEPRRVWTLGPTGYELLLAHQLDDGIQHLTAPSVPDLRHIKAVTEVRWALEKTYELVTAWQSERALNRGRAGRRAVPDARATWQGGRKYCLEVELSPKSRKRYREVLARYKAAQVLYVTRNAEMTRALIKTFHRLETSRDAPPIPAGLTVVTLPALLAEGPAAPAFTYVPGNPPKAELKNLYRTSSLQALSGQLRPPHSDVGAPSGARPRRSPQEPFHVRFGEVIYVVLDLDKVPLARLEAWLRQPTERGMQALKLATNPTTLLQVSPDTHVKRLGVKTLSYQKPRGLVDYSALHVELTQGPHMYSRGYVLPEFVDDEDFLILPTRNPFDSEPGFEDQQIAME